MSMEAENGAQPHNICAEVLLLRLAFYDVIHSAFR